MQCKENKVWLRSKKYLREEIRKYDTYLIVQSKYDVMI